jgi:hypothetical protein
VSEKATEKKTPAAKTPVTVERPPHRQPGTREHLGEDPVYAGEPNEVVEERRGARS